MADTYHPQMITFGASQTIVSSEILAPSIKHESYDNIPITSTQIPMHREIINQMELYAPGILTSWPDDRKPQYRIPTYATEVTPTPPVVTTTFPALTLAF